MQSALRALLAGISLSVAGNSGYSGGDVATGRAAKSPESQQELIAAAKAKRERRARSPGRCQTRYLKGGIDYVPYAARKPSQASAWIPCGHASVRAV